MTPERHVHKMCECGVKLRHGLSYFIAKGTAEQQCTVMCQMGNCKWVTDSKSALNTHVRVLGCVFVLLPSDPSVPHVIKCVLLTNYEQTTI